MSMKRYKLYPAIDLVPPPYVIRVYKDGKLVHEASGETEKEAKSRVREWLQGEINKQR